MHPSHGIPPPIWDYQSHGLTPVAEGERIETLDILRGVALLGILTVNMTAFSWPYEYIFWQSETWDTRADAVMDWLVRFLAEAKFYPLFSLLFGLGAAIQMERAQSRGVPFRGRFCRRMTVLLAIGMAHALLVWDGDILVWYAACGFLLLPFQGRRPKTILVWAFVGLLIPASLTILLWALLAGLALVPEVGTAIQKGVEEYYGTYADQRAALDETIQVFASGGYTEIFRARLEHTIYSWLAAIFYLPEFLGLFLLGLYAGKRRIFQDVSGNADLLMLVSLGGMAIGLPLSFLNAACMASSDLADQHFLWLLSHGLASIGGPAQSLAYAAALTLLLRNDRLRRCLSVFAAAGRMALSNYLFQSLACTTIFYSYGLGLFGAAGPVTRLWLAATIFVAQAGLSSWWLSRFQFGPMEWLWRTLSYGRLQPMRR